MDDVDELQRRRERRTLAEISGFGADLVALVETGRADGPFTYLEAGLARRGIPAEHYGNASLPIALAGVAVQHLITYSDAREVAAECFAAAQKVGVRASYGVQLTEGNDHVVVQVVRVFRAIREEFLGIVLTINQALPSPTDEQLQAAAAQADDICAFVIEFSFLLLGEPARS